MLRYIPDKYRKYASLYPYIIPLFGKMYQGRIKVIIKLFKQFKKKFLRVLEVGGGFGLFSLNFKVNFPNVKIHITDKSSTEISIVANKIFLERFKTKAIFDFELDIQKKTRYADESFDLVFVLDVLEHVDNPSQAIDEILRILKKKGILFISVPLEGGFLKVIRWIYSYFELINKNPHWEGLIKNEKEFNSLLTQKNLNILWQKKYPFNSLPVAMNYDMFYLIQKN
jgi:ubiquinone/menaquinone biosynthesis C-methylase UbiE